MGQVFSWEAVDNRQVPKLESFPLVVDRIRQIFDDRSSIVGGLLLGSALTETFAITSDIDLLIVYDDACEGEYVRLMQNLTTFAAARFVPIQCTSISHECARLGIHDVTCSYQTHLVQALKRRGILKESPLPCISLDGKVSLRRDVAEYIFSRQKILFEIICAKGRIGYDRYRAAQRVLEMAPHICRKVLEVWEKRPLRDAKADVIAVYGDVTDVQAAKELLQYLTNARLEYVEEVKKQLESSSYCRYEQLITNILTYVARAALDFTKIAMTQVT